jgi:glycosyltransferase involved in cell wall biosynthesis
LIERFNQPVRRALFIGRIHPKKGILSLIDAWAAIRPEGWMLDVAGPDEGGHMAEVEAKIKQHQLEDKVVCHGPIFGEQKEKLFHRASLLVVPSLSENFGIVVAEGLACGLPVIATTGMPWEILVQKECGWWIHPDAGSLAETLTKATRLSAAELARMGERGRVLAETGLAWPVIIEQMVESYSWMIKKNLPPRCVRLN